MKNILFVIGTRPEAIKLAPLILQMRKESFFSSVKVCLTAQHRQMLDQVLDFFEITADYDMNLMKAGQTLHSLTSDIIIGMKPILDQCHPDLVIVHGDTTTSMAVGLAAFYSEKVVAHIEAGLRTYNKKAPFPEEMNRSITARIADIHFAPTISAKNNLLTEGIIESDIVVTGNTVIDALKLGLQKIDESDENIMMLQSSIDFKKKIILVTGHRRENFGDGFEDICKALKELSKIYENEIEIVYPVHLNPNVQDPVNKILSNTPNIKLISPLSYQSFIWLMNKSYLIITDSGGIQEEAPSLGKPVLVMRNTTERPEAVSEGTVILVGTDKDKILNEASRLLNDSNFYKQMSGKYNPYGDGKSCNRIIEYLKGNKIEEYV